MSTYYNNTCEYYYSIIQDIAAEKKMAKKLELGASIPEFFYFYLRKIGVKHVENVSKNRKDDGSFFNLVKFITSLENNTRDKETRIDAFRKDEPSWYTQELLGMVAEQKLSIGIGKKKLEDILDGFVPLRRPAEDEEYDPEDNYEQEEIVVDKDIDPLEEADLYKTYVLLAKSEEAKTYPIEYPALVQKKYDGTRRLVFSTGNNVFFKTRQGKAGLVPKHIKKAVLELHKDYGPLVLDGEFFVPDVERAKSNGIANKKDISEQKDLVMAAWDLFKLKNYKDLEKLKTSKYTKRFNKLGDLLEGRGKDFPILQAESWVVESKEEALAKAKELADDGEEGGVLKDKRLTFDNGRSNFCIKLKKVYDCNLKITGINPGEGKLLGTIGSFSVESADGKIQANISGMSDEIRNKVPLGKKADKYWIDKIVNVTFLEINKANKQGIHTLHSPQFSRVNDEVDEADTLKTVLAVARGELI